MCFHVCFLEFRCSYLERSEGITTAAQCSHAQCSAMLGGPWRQRSSRESCKGGEMWIILGLSGVFDWGKALLGLSCFRMCFQRGVTIPWAASAPTKWGEGCKDGRKNLQGFEMWTPHGVLMPPTMSKTMFRVEQEKILCSSNLSMSPLLRKNMKISQFFYFLKFSR